MEKQEQIATRLFAGYLIDSPLQYQLERSEGWKQAQIVPSKELQVVPRQGESYIGVSVNSPTVSIEKLKAIQEEVAAKLTHYCPTYSLEPNKLTLFPQLMIY